MDFADKLDMMDDDCDIQGFPLDTLKSGDCVITPGGVGTLFSIDSDKVTVEMDYRYLVGYPVDSVKLYKEEVK